MLPVRYIFVVFLRGQMTCPWNDVFGDAGATPASLFIRTAIWPTRAPTRVGGGPSTLAEKSVEYHETPSEGREIIKLTILQKISRYLL